MKILEQRMIGQGEEEATLDKEVGERKIGCLEDLLLMKKDMHLLTHKMKMIWKLLFQNHPEMLSTSYIIKID